VKGQVLDGTHYYVGDHIFIQRNGYDHHGIVFATDGRSPGNIKQVAHIISPEGGDMSAADLGDMAQNTFIITGVDWFLQGSKYTAIKRMRYGAVWSDVAWDVHSSPFVADSSEVVMARARWLLQRWEKGINNYDILFQNCEHAAHWCRTGQQLSRQSLSLRDAAPFAAEDSALMEEVERCRRDVAASLPHSGELVLLSRTTDGASLRSDGEFSFSRGAVFRVHALKKQAVGDPRTHALLAFEDLARGCFLGVRGAHIICGGNPEGFVADTVGRLQHFDTGLFVAMGPDSDSRAHLADREDFATSFRWPRRWAWLGKLVALGGAVAVTFAVLRFLCQRNLLQHIIGHLLHLVHLLLAVSSCVTFWANNQPIGCVIVAVAIFTGLLGDRTASKLLPFAVVCTVSSFLVMAKALALSDPMFTAVAEAILACALVCVSFELTLGVLACCRGQAPSQLLAACTGPTIFVCTLVAFLLGGPLLWKTIVVRVVTVLIGASQLTSSGVAPPWHREQGLDFRV